MPPSKPASLKIRAEDWLNHHLTRLPYKKKILFVHNLHSMTKAGLALVESLNILSEQAGNKPLQIIIEQVKAQVEKGQPLSESLSNQPKLFPPMYVTMIEAGEAAGTLEDSLEQVHLQMKKSHELASKIRGALIYPAVLLVAMVAIGIEMVFFVLPKLIVMFRDFDAELPLATRLLIGTVNFTSSYGVLMLISVGIFITAFIILMRQQDFKRTVQQFFLLLPVVGKVIKKINQAKFTLTMSSLLKSTIPIVEAVKISARVLGTISYKEELTRVAEALKKGEPLSDSLAQYPKHFSPMLVQMVMVGEKSGELEHMLEELASYYASEVDDTMKNFSTIIEPVIIVLLGLAVGAIAVAVVMPMYSLAQSF